jgi:GntR family transcriptional repressor for pyruvate dehydrogenase complex
MQFKPVERNSLVQSVVEQLLDQIKNGSLAPGDRLPSERELMHLLKVGRSTIREALRSLAMLNLVDLRPGQGSFVKEMGLGSVINADLLSALMDRNRTADLVEMRRMIEPPAMELAAARATEEELSKLYELLRRGDELHEMGKSSAEVSAQLHVEMVRCTHNGVLAMVMESVFGLLTERGAQLEHLEGFHEWETLHHRELVDALATRDGHLAHRLMLRHLDASARRLLDDPETKIGGE